MRTLIGYPWPGNVRELRTAIEHGVVMCNGPKITLRHLPASVRDGSGSSLTAGTRDPGEAGGGAAPGDLDLEATEQRMIGRALERTGGNRSRAADLLGISRRTLQRKLKALQDENSG